MVHQPGGTQRLKPQNIIDTTTIRPGMTVVELGCGAVGYCVFPAAQAVGSRGRVYAVDVRKPVLAAITTRARVENLTQIIPLWGDAEKSHGVHLPAHMADVVTLINVLFQNTNRQQMLTEALRLLKPGGQLLVVDWKPNTPIGPPPAQAVNAAGVIAWAIRAGLTLTKEFSPSRMHFGLLFTLNSPAV
ncbi:MAG: methyltransferase domain-containing protein [Patescibacteria group bacterium]